MGNEGGVVTVAALMALPDAGNVLLVLRVLQLLLLLLVSGCSGGITRCLLVARNVALFGCHGGIVAAEDIFSSHLTNVTTHRVSSALSYLIF